MGAVARAGDLGGAGLEGELVGEGREQPGLRQLARRPSWEEIVRVVEELKQEKWEQFRDRRGDWGRDVALYLGRKHGGLKLRQSGELAAVDYASVGMALGRLQEHSLRDRHLARRLRQAEALLNVET